MFYQIEKDTNIIVGISDKLDRWDITRLGYDFKESNIKFNILEQFIESEERLKESIKPERNKLLELTDRFLVPDRPVTEEQREELIVYRQALRNLPETISLENPDFPVKPDFI